MNKKKSPNKSTKYKGVTRRGAGSFEVTIAKDGVYFYLGSFNDVISAANCYNYHAKKLFGEFARVNDIEFLQKEEWGARKSIKENSSQFKGVHWSKKRQCWIAKIWAGSKETFIGCYTNELASSQRI